MRSYLGTSKRIKQNRVPRKKGVDLPGVTNANDDGSILLLNKKKNLQGGKRKILVRTSWGRLRVHHARFDRNGGVKEIYHDVGRNDPTFHRKGKA